MVQGITALPRSGLLGRVVDTRKVASAGISVAIHSGRVWAYFAFCIPNSASTSSSNARRLSATHSRYPSGSTDAFTPWVAARCRCYANRAPSDRQPPSPVCTDAERSFAINCLMRTAVSSGFSSGKKWPPFTACPCTFGAHCFQMPSAPPSFA